MTRALLLLCLLLPGCSAVAPLAAADTASVIVFGHDIFDLAYSGITGRDCSVVRLDKGENYCAPPYRPLPPPYCTQTLGTVDCWADGPKIFANPPRSVADGPNTAAAAAVAAHPPRWPDI